MNSQLRTQQGVYIVEFAVVGSIFLFVLFAIIESGRLMYTWSGLTAVTQRGARVAVVCPLNDDLIKQIAIYGTESSTSSRLLPFLTTDHVELSYLNSEGATVSTYEDTEFVQVSIRNYTHSLILPNIFTLGVADSFQAPQFTTTMPAESLGYNPDTETRVCSV